MQQGMLVLSSNNTLYYCKRPNNIQKIIFASCNEYAIQFMFLKTAPTNLKISPDVEHQKSII